MDRAIKEVDFNDLSTAPKAEGGQATLAHEGRYSASKSQAEAFSHNHLDKKSIQSDAPMRALVAKAQAIVESTKSDPYMRAIELNKLRTEYADSHPAGLK